MELSSNLKKVVTCGMVSLMLVTGCSCTNKNTSGNNNNGGNSTNNGGTNTNVNEPSVENPVVVNNEALNQDGQIEQFAYEISGITYDGNMTTLTVSVTNLTAEVQNLDWITASVTYMDGEIERKVDLIIYVGESLQPNETRTTTASADTDLRNTTNVTYTVQR